VRSNGCAIYIGQTDKASGTQLIQELKSEGIYEVTPYAPPPGTDKIMRLNAQTAPFENGSVLLPRNAPWLADYIAELTGFPGSRHGDQVDSTTQALDYLRTTFARENWIYTTDWDKLEQSLKEHFWSKGRDWRTR
jgi:predicted phage terminase large subunit-like protein